MEKPPGTDNIGKLSPSQRLKGQVGRMTLESGKSYGHRRYVPNSSCEMGEKYSATKTVAFQGGIVGEGGRRQ